MHVGCRFPGRLLSTKKYQPHKTARKIQENTRKYPTVCLKCFCSALDMITKTRVIKKMSTGITMVMHRRQQVNNADCGNTIKVSPRASTSFAITCTVTNNACQQNSTNRSTLRHAIPIRTSPLCVPYSSI